MRVNEHADPVTIYEGEAEELRRLTAEFGGVLSVMRRIVRASVRLAWVTAGYGWFTIIAPTMIAAPGYFGGDLSFGEMMVAVGAFIQVSTNTTQSWRRQPDHPLEWEILPNGLIRYRAGAVRARAVV